MLLEPKLVLLVGIEVVQNDVKLAVRKGGNDAVHEAEELDAASAAFCARPGSCRSRHREPRTRSSSHASCSRGSGRSAPARSAASDSLAPALRPGSTASHRRKARWPCRAGRYRGRRHRLPLEANPDRCFRTRTRAYQIDLLIAQEAPDILHIDIAKLLRQKRAGPARKALRQRLVEQRQNPLVRLLRVDRLFAQAKACPEDLQAVIGKRRRQWLTSRGSTPTSLAIDRVLRPAAARSTIRARFKSRCIVTGDRQRASSTSRSLRESGLLLLRESFRP